MYFGSLNEIPASLVCIINIVRLEFQIQTLFIFIETTPFWHLYCNSNSYIEVCPTKFTFVNIKSRGFWRIYQIFPRRFEPL
jgi:hypothetical protein